jgi:hypothetical protein
MQLRESELAHHLLPKSPEILDVSFAAFAVNKFNSTCKQVVILEINVALNLILDFSQASILVN